MKTRTKAILTQAILVAIVVLVVTVVALVFSTWTIPKH